MKIIKSNIKQGWIRLLPETKQDLLDIFKVVEKGDLVNGITTRKIKIGDENSTKSVRKAFLVELKVEKKELDNKSGALRFLGKVVSENEEIPRGSYHSLTISPHDEITIKKEKWENFQLQRIRKAQKRISYSVLVVVFDREEAVFALLNPVDYEIVGKLKGNVRKKYVEEGGENFYRLLAREIEEKTKLLKVDYVICASPAFYNEELEKELNSKEIAAKVIFSHASSAGERGVAEVIKRDEIRKILKEQRLNEENMLVQHLLKNISQNKRYAYGIRDVLVKAQMGAIDKLLINEDLVFSENRSKEVEEILTLVEETKGEVHVIESEEAKEIINSLGGVGAILRY